MTVKEIFSFIERQFIKNQAKLLGDSVYHFSLSGAEAGEWQLIIEDGKARVLEGKVKTPGVTMSMTSSCFKEIIHGNLNPVHALTSNQIKLQGDKLLFLKFFDEYLFNLE